MKPLQSGTQVRCSAHDEQQKLQDTVVGQKSQKKTKPFGKNLKLIIYLDSGVFKCIQKFREPGYRFQQAGNREQNLHLCAQHSL